jgi:hypothetical protein
MELKPDRRVHVILNALPIDRRSLGDTMEFSET